MPEGQPQSQPGSAEEQVDFEVKVAQTTYVIARTFGAEYTRQSGGGGGGHYELSLADLDEIIADVKFEREGIFEDGIKIRRAIGFVEPPARDIMSQLQAQATITSWEAAYEHNRRMLVAADAEIEKLETARKAYSQVENANATDMRKQG